MAKKATKKSKKKMPGIVTTAKKRKKAGLRYKLTEGYDRAAQAHVKDKKRKRKVKKK